MKKKRPTNKAFFKTNHNVVDSNKFRSLPASAQCLYFHLTRLENWFCNGKHGSFEQRDWQLTLETGLAHATIERGRNILEDQGFIKTNRQGPHAPTAYTVLAPMEGKDGTERTDDSK